MDVLTIQLGWMFGYKPRSAPTPPVPPAPVVVVTEERRWPGPPFILYQDGNIIPVWQRQREDEEIVLI